MGGCAVRQAPDDLSGIRNRRCALNYQKSKWVSVERAMMVEVGGGGGRGPG